MNFNSFLYKHIPRFIPTTVRLLQLLGYFLPNGAMPYRRWTWASKAAQLREFDPISCSLRYVRSYRYGMKVDVKVDAGGCCIMTVSDYGNFLCAVASWEKVVRLG